LRVVAGLEHQQGGAFTEDKPILSNGRDAAAGSSWRGDSARIAANAAIGSG
jgi:hypothetical protein